MDWSRTCRSVPLGSPARQSQLFSCQCTPNPLQRQLLPCRQPAFGGISPLLCRSKTASSLTFFDCAGGRKRNFQKNLENLLTNPLLVYIIIYVVSATTSCGCSSMVESQPSKLVAWVRFPSPAPSAKLTAIGCRLCRWNDTGTVEGRAVRLFRGQLVICACSSAG